MPVVNVGTRGKPIYLPADVCKVEPGQLSKLSDAHVRDMVRFARRTPDKCARSIVEQGRKTLGYASQSKAMRHFGIMVGNDMITVPSRILKSPTVEYTQRDEHGEIVDMLAVQPKEGSWNFGLASLHKTFRLDTWYCLRIATGNFGNNLPPSGIGLEEHLDLFRGILSKGGIVSSAPIIKEIVISRGSSEDSALDQYFQWIRNQNTAAQESKQMSGQDDTSAGGPAQQRTVDPPLLLIILPSNDVKLYRKIKLLADRSQGIHTVCVTGTGADSGDRKPYDRCKGSEKKFYGQKPDQYFANVALKINLKRGGTNHLLQNPERFEPINGGSTMVVGIDVTHPSPGSNDDAPSVFAVVASTDRDISQWPAAMGVQRKSKEEVIRDKEKLKLMFLSRLQLWMDRNHGKRPKYILIYRDGVSVSQYQAVLDNELQAMRDACKVKYPSNLTANNFPKIAFIVVAKRHHTRFYPTNEKDADFNWNAKCGTVVDRGITQAQEWDFYLQSHSVALSGMARPAHYVVLHDEIFALVEASKRADMLQQMTYNMCYLYGPATKAISICPAVYYADKACTRGRLFLHDQFSPTPPGAKSRKEIEKTETEAQKAIRLARERDLLKNQQSLILPHPELKKTMYYV